MGQVKGKWLLSYDDNPYVRELYRDYFILEAEVRYTANNRAKSGGKLS